MPANASYPRHQRPPQHAGYSADANHYARNNYGSSASGTSPRPVPKRSSLLKRVLKVVGIVLGVVIAAALVFALWFTISLDSRLAEAQGDVGDLSQVLVEAEPGKPFYTLLLGSDSREGSLSDPQEMYLNGNERTDVIMLARIDPSNKQVTLVSIPRDTPYTMEDGSVAKINEAYNHGGVAESIKAISNLTGVGISHYAEVKVSQLEAIVDSLGGIDIYVDRKLKVPDTHTGETIEIKKGQQTLNGRQAQAFVRARHEYNREGEAQDVNRQGNVRTFTQALAKKVLDRPAFELPGVILDLSQYVGTDMRSKDLIPLGMSFMGGDMTTYSCTGPTEGYTAEEYGGIWLCYPNPEGWAELMRQVDTGLEPGDIDFVATQIVPGSSETTEAPAETSTEASTETSEVVDEPASNDSSASDTTWSSPSEPVQTQDVPVAEAPAPEGQTDGSTTEGEGEADAGETGEDTGQQSDTGSESSDTGQQEAGGSDAGASDVQAGDDGAQ